MWQALVDLDREPWASRMRRLLRRANLAVRWAGARQRELRPSLVERIERRSAQGGAEALAYPEAQPPLPASRPQRHPERNLAWWLRNGRESVLRFLREPAIPFSHSQAEQDVRMRKVRQKTSGGFRSE